MFQSARIKLTTWYLLIIMCISMLFSVIIYANINSEFVRIEHFQQMRREKLERAFPGFSFRSIPGEDPDAIPQARHRLIFTLIIINGSILFLSGLAGYFLAGRTLKPIKTMIDEQHRFITDASHELKTPLTALRSEIEVYLMGKKRTLKDAETILASNLEEVIRLQNLSESLVRLAKHRETNTEGLHTTTLSLLDVVESALKKVVPLARKKHITINNDITDVKIVGEKESLIEAFVVLLDNAIKYSPEQTTVTISSKETDKSVRIHVMDQGVGIDPQDVPHIFERFYRADKSRTKSETTGYGLGLAIVKQIIHDHKGSISVKSKTGKGTTFTLRLPTQK